MTSHTVFFSIKSLVEQYNFKTKYCQWIDRVFFFEFLKKKIILCGVKFTKSESVSINILTIIIHLIHFKIILQTAKHKNNIVHWVHFELKPTDIC